MNILVCDKMEEEVLEKIKELGDLTYKPENLLDAVKEAEVMVVRSATKVTKEVMDNAPKLKLVIRAGVGLDNVDLEYAKEKGINVANTPGASTNAVAELTIAMILNLLRMVYFGHEQMKKGNWAKKQISGQEVKGKTLGIIGCGRIGTMAAEKAHALGMKVIAFDPHPREGSFIEFVSLDDLYSRADVISLHTVLIPQTKEMINKDTIEKMKDGVFIVNLARGRLIQENDLYEGLKNGKIKGAALDVYSEEPYSGKLLELENILFTPHIGAGTKEAQTRIGEEVVEKIKELKG